MQRNTEPKIFCIKYNKSLFVQRQQYSQLREPEVYSKAKVWKAFDETEQERRQASYKEVLSQQKSVSTFINDCVSTGANAHKSVSLTFCLCRIPPQLTLSIQAILNNRRNQATD